MIAGTRMLASTVVQERHRSSFAQLSITNILLSSNWVILKSWISVFRLIPFFGRDASSTQLYKARLKIVDCFWLSSEWSIEFVLEAENSHHWFLNHCSIFKFLKHFRISFWFLYWFSIFYHFIPITDFYVGNWVRNLYCYMP